jgi:hypothetical protein
MMMMKLHKKLLLKNITARQQFIISRLFKDKGFEVLRINLQLNVLDAFLTQVFLQLKDKKKQV